MTVRTYNTNVKLRAGLKSGPLTRLICNSGASSMSRKPATLCTVNNYDSPSIGLDIHQW